MPKEPPVKLVIDVPDSIFPALQDLADSVNKQAQQYVQDHVNDSIRQRLYHLRETDNQLSPGLCGFRPNSFRGDRPTLSPEIFAQVEPPQRRCPECLLIFSPNDSDLQRSRA